MRASKEPRSNFTTTLPASPLRELDRAAKETGMRKNEILVQAFMAWEKERKQASHTSVRAKKL
jgi:hypothetical protein